MHAGTAAPSRLVTFADVLNDDSMGWLSSSDEETEADEDAYTRGGRAHEDSGVETERDGEGGRGLKRFDSLDNVLRIAVVRGGAAS